MHDSSGVRAHDTDTVQPVTVPPPSPRGVGPDLLRLLHVATRYGVGPYLVVADGTALVGCSYLLGMSAAAWLAPLGVMVALQVSGLQRSRLSLSVLDDLWRLVAQVALGGGLACAALAWASSGGAAANALKALPFLAMALVLERALFYAAVRAGRRHGLIGHPTLIVGSGQVARQLIQTLRERPEHGLRPLGRVSADTLYDDQDADVLGGAEDLPRVIQENRAAVVIVAFVSADHALVDIIRTCDRLHCDIFYVPRLFELHSTGHDEDAIRGIPLVRLNRPAFRAWTWRSKRALDLALAGVALLLALPVMAACALAVRLEVGPQVLFRQCRVGLDGREFWLLKFRSMRPGGGNDPATTWNVADSAAIGPVGRFLRRTSLDELPQLFNVLRGDMTLVGPRPERPHFVDMFAAQIPRYRHRCRVPAGMTGWAQVHGLRGDTPVDERVRFDNYYIENWSFWLDVKILLRTLPQLLRGAGR